MSDFEMNKPQTLQVYTMAQAFRSKIISTENSCSTAVSTHQPDSEMSKQIKEIIKMDHKVESDEWHPKSRLPMKMVVSKMASRTPVDQENEDPLEGIDLSMLRKHKSSPPSWLKKPYQRRNSKPTKVQNTVSTIKEKVLQINPDYLRNPNVVNQGTSFKKVIERFSNLRNADIGSHTSLLDNYNQLYNKRKKMTENATETNCLNESPRGGWSLSKSKVISERNHKVCQANINASTSIEENGERNSDCTIPQLEFKWNPIISQNSPKRNSPLHWLNSSLSSDSDVQYEYKNESYTRYHSPPKHDTKSTFSALFESVSPEWGYKAVPRKRRILFTNPECSYSYSRKECETSPTSWNTIAEERHRLTCYTSSLSKRFHL